jgi:outer membrane autotransporter protein
VWVRGTGTWSEYEDSATTSAYGRTSRYDLTRDLNVFDFETGVDFGKRAVFSGNDMLVFGILGGVVGASLDYDTLARQFDFTGGEIGAYATYLNGGLFVDTLVKVDFLEIETQAIGFPHTIDATTWGVRTDAGYRFGGFGGGAYIEPLATIAVAWSDLDGFTNGGNKVSFDDEANVRGRVGLRVGTSNQVWSGVTMEPFVIGSLWGTLSGDNTATLVSSGKSFSFTDEPPDSWGQISTGVNFFSPSANTSVFAKVDFNFGDELTGIGARAGMRVKW